MKDDPNDMFTWTRCFAQPDSLTIIDMVHPLTGHSQLHKETLEEIQKRYPGAQLFDFDEFTKFKEQKLCSEPLEIDQERYMKMLEVLPPQRWVQRNGNSTFELSEHVSGRVTSIFCRTGGRYFEFSGIAGTPHDEIVARCRDAVSKTGVQPDIQAAALVSSAAAAIEEFSEDELETHAEKQREQK